MFGGRRLVFYELNEVPLRVFEWYAGRNPDSAIARLLEQGLVLQTMTEDTGHLSPWVTWPTLHRGVLNTQHAIFDFGQDLREVNRDFPPVWELLAQAGRKVGMFGSLHSYPLPENVAENYAFYVPDTFAAGPETFPAQLGAFQSFNLAMVDRSGRNVSSGIALGEASRFLAMAPRLGLRGATAMALAGQMLTERIKPRRVVRRRTSQVQIAFDFFMKALRNETPDAAFFFTNHVASSMHRYWPTVFPDDYRAKFWSNEWAENWSGEIPFAMGEANKQLSRLMSFVSDDPRYSLVVTTSMGQSAVNIDDAVKTQLCFKDVRTFMRLLGFGDDEWRRERAMVPLYTIAVTPQLAEIFEQRCASFRINGEPLSVERRGSGVFRLKTGQENLPTERIEVNYDQSRITLQEAGLENVQIQDESGSYAYHVPEGSLIVYNSTGANSAAIAKRSRVSTLAIAPAVLSNFGIQRPPYMRDPSLLAA